MSGFNDESLGRLVLALDTPDWPTYVQWCRFFGPRVGVLKVGLEAFSRWGLRAIEVARRDAREVFLDIKLHDIPHTVHGAVEAARNHGVDYLTVHSAGGSEMLAAACASSGGAVKILAVTLLTHLGSEDLSVLDLPGDSSRRVQRWAALARRAGCDGAVCSPLEVAAVRRENSRPFLLVTPGIRSDRVAADDQQRVATPEAALRAGADMLVVGRPITLAADPERALEALAQEMQLQ